MEYRLTTFDDLHVGQSATLSRTIREEDLAAFVQLTGDSNPIHVDDEFAQRTFFGRRIAHGLLTASMLSTMIGMKLPGVGAIYRSQTLEFVKAVYPGDELTLTATVTELDAEANLIRMACEITRADGATVLRGTTESSLIRGFR